MNPAYNPRGLFIHSAGICRAWSLCPPPPPPATAARERHARPSGSPEAELGTGQRAGKPSCQGTEGFWIKQPHKGTTQILREVFRGSSKEEWKTAARANAMGGILGTFEEILKSEISCKDRTMKLKTLYLDLPGVRAFNHSFSLSFLRCHDIRGHFLRVTTFSRATTELSFNTDTI